ncbi:MAG: hypothetical protein PHR96_00645 [Clostridia bacterium]|nr:hypothetical protein [Clostridia bacterium]
MKFSVKRFLNIKLNRDGVLEEEKPELSFWERKRLNDQMKNRLRYLKHSKQEDTFTEIPEFESIISQIEKFKPGYEFGTDSNFFGVESEFLLSDGRNIEISSAFYKTLSKFIHSETIHKYVSMDFVKDGFANGIMFELMGEKIGLRNGDDKDKRNYDYVTHVTSPKYSFQTENNFYFDKKWIGKGFYKLSNGSYDNYKGTGVVALNIKPIDKNLYEKDGKIYLIRYTSYTDYHNQINPFAVASNAILNNRNCDLLVLEDSSEFNNKTTYQEMIETFERNKDKIIQFKKQTETRMGGEISN